MNTLSLSQLAAHKRHPILRNVFYDIMQQLKLQGKEAMELSDEQLTELQWSGGDWNGAQWSGAQWTGGQWSGAQWSGSDWSGDH